MESGRSQPARSEPGLGEANLPVARVRSRESAPGVKSLPRKSFPSSTAQSAMQSAPGNYRWRICALLFAATTINYIDRQALGVLAPDLGRIIGWNEIQYSYIVSSFQAAYAIGLVCTGAVIDRL